METTKTAGFAIIGKNGHAIWTDASGTQCTAARQALEAASELQADDWDLIAIVSTDGNERATFRYRDTELILGLPIN